MSKTLLQNIDLLHINVLLQNIDAIRGQNVQGLTPFGKVTCTTNHEAYSNARTREELGVPVHKLSVGIYQPDFFDRWDYEDKEQILVVSHDDHPLKLRVLQQIADLLPTLQIRVVENLSYEDYKQLISRAKWSLTFGEGLDGYFIESTLSGAVPFAVYNDRFFTPAFANLETVYPNWEVLIDQMPRDLVRLDRREPYQQCWEQAFSLISELYSAGPIP